MKITIFPGKYHQNGGFSMAMLVSGRVFEFFYYFQWTNFWPDSYSKHLIPPRWPSWNLEVGQGEKSLKEKVTVFGICSHLSSVSGCWILWNRVGLCVCFFCCVPTQTFATLLFGRLMECKSMMIILQHQDCCRCSTYPSNKGLSSGSTTARVH